MEVHRHAGSAAHRGDDAPIVGDAVRRGCPIGWIVVRLEPDVCDGGWERAIRLSVYARRIRYNVPRRVGGANEPHGRALHNLNTAAHVARHEPDTIVDLGDAGRGEGHAAGRARDGEGAIHAIRAEIGAIGEVQRVDPQHGVGGRRRCYGGRDHKGRLRVHQLVDQDEVALRADHLHALDDRRQSRVWHRDLRDACGEQDGHRAVKPDHRLATRPRRR